MTDVNDNAPVFGQGGYSAEVTEDLTPGELVMKVRASLMYAWSHRKRDVSIQASDRKVYRMCALTDAVKVTSPSSSVILG